MVIVKLLLFPHKDKFIDRAAGTICEINFIISLYENNCSVKSVPQVQLFLLLFPVSIDVSCQIFYLLQCEISKYSLCYYFHFELHVASILAVVVVHGSRVMWFMLFGTGLCEFIAAIHTVRRRMVDLKDIQVSFAQTNFSHYSYSLDVSDDFVAIHAIDMKESFQVKVFAIFGVGWNC